MQTISRASPPVEIRRDGIFDVAAAQSVVAELKRAPEGRAVRIDVTHVREFHDFAVAVLAEALACRSEHVEIRGLRQHHARLLEYLGLGQAAESTADSAWA